MKTHHLLRLTVVAAVGLLSIPLRAGEINTQGVSPGAPDRVARIDGACPTFSWEATPGAQRYELAVYRVDGDGTALDSIVLFPENEVLFVSISGRATGWSPESSNCFLPGGRYAWFIRAVTDRDADGAGEWSQPRFFEVAAAPSPEQVRQALDVLTRYLASGHGQADLETPVGDEVIDLADDGAGRRGPAPRDGGSAAKIREGAVAAIRGEMSGPSGEEYGVLGVTNTHDGAGIAAMNLVDGPDLVLDGSANSGQADTLISQSGLDRPSSDPETFTIRNSGGGAMQVEVLGSILGDGSGLTSVDAETLDGTDGADFATDDEALALVATHAASADHDGRYYTETELNTPSEGVSVHWDNLGGVPEGFADGVDDDTTYSFGPGLTLDGDQVVVDPTAFVPVISTLDINFGVTMVGKYNSIAIGSDGLGLISYYEEMVTYDLKVAHCNDLPCTSATISTVDGGPGLSGWYSSIAIGSDGLGLISYYDSSALVLKAAHCNDIPCTSATISPLDSTGGAGSNTSIAIGVDDLGLICYYDNTNHDLKVAHCSDVSCSSATVTTLDSTGDVGRYCSIAIGPLGLGVISYKDETNGALKVAQCSNLTCTGASIKTFKFGADTGDYSSIAIGGDGLALIAYSDPGENTLEVAHCNDALCTSATRSRLVNHAVMYASLAIAADGYGLISYSESPDGLKVAHCRDAGCTNATIRSVANVYVWYTSIAVGTDGLGLISYYDSSNYALKAAHLPYGY